MRHPPDPELGNSDPDGFRGELTPPAGLPVAEPDEKCDDPVNIVTTVGGADAIVFAIDVSGSMKNTLTSGGESEPRIEWAKGAARAMAELVALHNDAPENAGKEQMLGLVTFATQAEPVFDLQIVDASNISTIVDDIDDLTADGATALTDGIFEAWTMIDGSTESPNNPAIVVMTDGDANVCFQEGMACYASMTCDCDDDPADEAVSAVADLYEEGVTVYFTPLGAENGAGVFGTAVQWASGEIFPAPDAFDLATMYARAYLRFSGFSAVIDGETWTAGSDSQNPPAWFDVRVEEGAGKLTLLLSARNLVVDDWDPTWALLSPSEQTYSYENPGIVDVYDDPSGSFYRILQVDAPEAGTWTLGLSTLGVIQRGGLTAWTDSPEPDCYVSAARGVVYDDQEDLEITVLTKYAGPVDEVDYTVHVLRPDGSEPVAVAMSPDPDEGGIARGFFPASEFHGRGTYVIFAECDASDAWFHPGEALDPDDDPWVATRAPAFHRETTGSFFLEVPEHAWLPPGGDCDGNGIPDECEGASCAQGWGYCDGQAVACSTYSNPGTCDAQPACYWWCNEWVGCQCRIAPTESRACEAFDEVDCGAADGCDWETPYPCPPDPSSLDTDGNGILDACDPDDNGNDVLDQWESPWCSEASEPCTSVQCGLIVQCCPGLTCGLAGTCE